MSSELPQPVSRLIDATNSGDTDAFLAAFGDSPVVDDWGREFPGTDAIRGWSDDEYIGKQVTLQVDSVTNNGNESTVVAQVGGNGFNGPSTFTFVTDGDRVSRMTIRA